jgi:hypothetical protein
MLSLMAMLDRQQIPEDLLRRSDEKDIDFFTAIGTSEGLSLATKEVENESFAIQHAFRAQHGVPAFNGEVIRHLPKGPDHPYSTAPTVGLLWGGLVPSRNNSVYRP